MADHRAVSTVDATLIQKYAPTILSSAVLVLGGLQVLVASAHGVVEILQFAALVISTIGTWRLTGWWKTAAEVAGVVIAAVLPFAIDHSLSWANLILIVIAVVKALAAQFGIQLRADTVTINSRSTPAAQVPTITSLPSTVDVATQTAGPVAPPTSVAPVAHLAP